MYRYRQGVEFRFHSTGRIYRMDWYYFLNTVINSIVLLSTAKVVADVYAVYLSPNATMIKKRTREHFNSDRRLAEIALKVHMV